MPFDVAGTKLWSNVMEILDEKDGVDTELLVYAMTLVNKVSEYNLGSMFYVITAFTSSIAKFPLFELLSFGPMFFFYP